jgi:hypothetical protein
MRLLGGFEFDLPLSLVLLVFVVASLFQFVSHNSSLSMSAIITSGVLNLMSM